MTTEELKYTGSFALLCILLRSLTKPLICTNLLLLDHSTGQIDKDTRTEVTLVQMSCLPIVALLHGGVVCCSCRGRRAEML